MQKSFKELLYVEIGRDIGSDKNIFLTLVKSHGQVIKAFYDSFKMSANLTSLVFKKNNYIKKTRSQLHPAKYKL